MQTLKLDRELGCRTRYSRSSPLRIPSAGQAATATGGRVERITLTFGFRNMCIREDIVIRLLMLLPSAIAYM